MPGFLSVRPQDWATLEPEPEPEPPPTGAGILLFGVEAEGQGIGGVHCRSTAGAWSASLLGETPKRLCGVPGSLTRAYCVVRSPDGSSLTFKTSNDGGATWSNGTMPTGTDNTGNSEWSHHICSPEDGTVFMIIGGDSACTARGIWKSTDNGSSWTRIVTFASPTGAWRCGNIEVTATHLWWTRFDAFSGASAQASVHYCGLDGSSVTDVPTITASGFNSPPKVRPASDTMVIVTTLLTTGAWKWTIGEGSATSIDTGAGPNNALEIVPLSTTVFLAFSYDPGSPGSGIWRSSDTGATWTQVADVELDLSGTDDNFARLLDVVKGNSDNAFCFGTRNRNSGSPEFEDNTQFYILTSVDGGLTWTAEDVTSAVPADPTVDLPIEYVWDLAALGGSTEGPDFNASGWLPRWASWFGYSQSGSFANVWWYYNPTIGIMWDDGFWGYAELDPGPDGEYNPTGYADPAPSVPTPPPTEPP